MLVINLFGGPGSGKSTIATGLFSMLKMPPSKLKIELFLEPFKHECYYKNHQLINFSDQLIDLYDKLTIILPQLDIAITDCPVELAKYYDPSNKIFEKYTFPALNIKINRVKPYIQNGRRQSEIEAKDIDQRLSVFTYNYTINGDQNGLNQLYNIVLKEINKKLDK